MQDVAYPLRRVLRIAGNKGRPCLQHAKHGGEVKAPSRKKQYGTSSLFQSAVHKASRHPVCLAVKLSIGQGFIAGYDSR